MNRNLNAETDAEWSARSCSCKMKCEWRAKREKVWSNTEHKKPLLMMEIHKKCNCYLGECAESDHYLLRLHRHISLAPFPPLRYYSFGEESRLIFLSSLYPPFSHHLPHTHSRLDTRAATADGSQKRGLLAFFLVEGISTHRVPIPSFLSALRDENMAVNINIFMLTILFVPISFLSFPFVNQLTLVSGPPRPELNARPALLNEI